MVGWFLSKLFNEEYFFLCLAVKGAEKAKEEKMQHNVRAAIAAATPPVNEISNFTQSSDAASETHTAIVSNGIHLYPQQPNLFVTSSN